MQEQLVSFKVAKLAKEKGFDNTHVDAYYHINKGYTLGYAMCISEVNKQTDGCLLAPTQSLLQKWLREVYNIHVEARKSVVSKQYFWRIVEWDKLTDWKLRPDSRYNSYETALEVGLQEALKLINNYE